MKKSTSGQVIGVQMVDASDGSAFTGSVTVYVTGDAGTQAVGSVGSGACTHEGNGYHTYAPAQAETNYDLIAFTFTGTGAVPATVQVFTSMDANLTAISGSSVSTSTAQLGVNVVNFGGSAGTFASGRPEVNTSHIAGSSVSTSSAQIGVNVVNAAGTAWASGAITSGAFASGAITASAIAADAIGASELAADAVTEIQNGLATSANVTSAVNQVRQDITLYNGDIGSGSHSTTTINMSMVAGLPAAGAWNGCPVAVYTVGLVLRGVGVISDWDGTDITTLTAMADTPQSTDTIKIYAPTVKPSAIRTEMDSNSTQLAAIVADTNELQTDWTNGGRLDLIVDGILTDTAEIGAAGAGLTAIPWNASWDAEVQSECADALAATDAIAAASISAAAANKIADHGRRRTQANVFASSDGDAISLASQATTTRTSTLTKQAHGITAGGQQDRVKQQRRSDSTCERRTRWRGRALAGRRNTKNHYFWSNKSP